MVSGVPHPKSARRWFGRLAFMPRVVMAGLFFLPLLSISNAQADSFPSGVFSLTPPNTSVDSKILTNPSVAGVTIRGRWPDVASSEGIYNWSYFDNQITRVKNAGKDILLRITAGGQNTPQWVYNEGAQTFTFVNSNPYSPTYQQTLTIPVFWDPIFLENEKTFIAAMGQHFTGNPNIVLVSMSCANATTDDWQMPSSKADVANWRAIGYRPDKLIEACEEILDATMTAFPNQTVLLAVGRSGNNLDPDPDYVARHVVSYARTTYPGRFIVQKNSLSADTPDPSIMPVLGAWQIIYDNQPGIAGQMLWAVTNDTACRMNGKVKPCDAATVLQDAVSTGVSYGMQYQEIYQKDILNPVLANIISTAAEMLTP
jgi:Beta-galactosidase